ncbi:hypothetical protein [Tenacibaculum sp. 190524A05c]|uniref:hypothetical protein n=1 Tax=Tenacibaculum platacis TaxID=3137852 RepID=UPI0032B19370
MRKLILYTILFSVGLLFNSCNNDNESPQDNTALRELVTRNLTENIINVKLPEPLISNTNENAKEVKAEFDFFVDLVGQLLTYLKVPENAISSKITENEESYNWFGFFINSSVVVKYNITRGIDKFNFVYNVTAGDTTLDAIKGYTSSNEQNGVFFVDTGSPVSLSWKITDSSNLILELMTPEKTTFTINKNNRSGKITYDTGVIYEWLENGSGQKTDENNTVFKW